MEKLKAVADKYYRWQPLIEEYIQRIETYRDTNFPVCVEHSKSLLETIAKEICSDKGTAFANDDGTGKLLKYAFDSLGFGNSNTIKQVSSGIANIGNHMSLLRNEIGAIAHGKTLEEIQRNKDIIDSTTSEFLLDSTELICVFLIQLFESGEIEKNDSGEYIEYDENTDFNEYWDDIYGEYIMGDYSYNSSLILHKLDPLAYKSELNNFKNNSDETNN